MFSGIVNTSLKFRFLVLILAAVVVVSTVIQVRGMPVDALPEFSPPFVEIQTEALGLSAEEVEQMITSPMEQDLLAGVAWLDVIRSESVPGLSSVIVYFEPGTDLFRARQMVAERLSQAAVGLPHVSKPPTMIQPQSSASRFITIGLTSKDLSLIELSVLTRWVISPRLLGVPGVANVAIWGLRDRQLQVLVDPERLRAQGVSLEQVVETTGNALWVSSLTFLEASSPGTGGFIDTPNQRLGIWHVLPITSPEDLAQVPVVERETPVQALAEGNVPLRLGDVAKVVEDHQPLIGDAIVSDNPSLMLVVEKLPGTNILEVTRGVEAAIEALRPGMAGVEFDATIFRPASFIELALANLSRAVVIGAVLAALALALCFYNWRAMFTGLIVIPLSLLAALFVLYLQGATLNAMVLAGLVITLSLVVDEAVTDIEHLVWRLRQPTSGATPPSGPAIILQAVSELRGVSFFAVLIILLAVVPLFFVDGVVGAILQPLVVTYVLAVVAALVVALTVTPALCLILLPQVPTAQLSPSESPFIRGLQNAYERLLAGALHRPAWAYAALIILTAAGIWALLPAFGPTPLVPDFREPYLTVHVESAPSTSRQEMNRIVGRLSQELKAISGVQDVGAHVGRAVFGDQVVGINSAQLWVEVDPKVGYEATVAAIQDAVNNYAGLQASVETYSQAVLNQSLASASDVLRVRVFGEDHEVLRTEAEKVRQTLAGVAGITNLQVDLPLEEPTLEIKVNIPAAQNYGLKPGDVRRTAATLLSGLQVGSLFEEQKVFDVVVWGEPDIRNNLTNIRELLIETPSGGFVRLEEVADVRIAPARTVIRREAISPYLDVTFNVQGRAVTTVANEVQALIRNIPFQLEYHAKVLGDFGPQQAAQQRLLITVLIVAAGILLLLQAALSSWRQAGLILLSLPLALAGGALANLITGERFSLVPLFGLFAIFGITVRNGLLLAHHLRWLERHRSDVFGLALVMRGARDRLAPIVTAAITSALALLPFIFFGNLPGLEIARPLALVVLSGLVTSTLFSLFIWPALYLHVGASREPELEFLPAPLAGEASSD